MCDANALGSLASGLMKRTIVLFYKAPVIYGPLEQWPGAVISEVTLE